MQSLLVVDKIKESDSNANPYIADAVIIALDAKEEILIVNTEDALHDIQNLKLINNYYDTLMETYADNKESNNLRSFHSKFKTLLAEIPALISVSNFSYEIREKLTTNTIKIDEKIKEIDLGIRKKNKFIVKQVDSKLEIFQYDEQLIRELAERSINDGNTYYTQSDFKKAKDCYIEALFLYTIVEKNLATFDPNLKNKIVELKAMYDDTKVKDSIQPKFDDFKKMHESQKKSIQSAIDTASCITLRDFDANDTRLTNFLILKFDSPSFKDPEFSNSSDLEKLFNVPVTSIRMTLSPLKLMTLKDTKLSILKKSIKKKSALGAALVSILQKQKEALYDALYPQQQATKIPINNPYGKYMIKLYINGTYKELVIDDYVHYRSSGNTTLSSLGEEMDFYFTIFNKAFQKLKYLGLKVDRNPAIYNYMILGPKWIPETHIFRGGDKTHQDWEIVKNASKCGILICRKKALKDPYEKRVFYNVISTIEWGESKIIFMQNLSIIDGDSISDDLMLQVNDLGGSQEAYDKIFQNFADKITEKNGMFVTSFEKLLRYFDQAYINWNTSTVLNTKLQQGYIKCGELFQNISSIHRSDSFVLTSDSYFASIEKNPQFKVQFKESYTKSVVWVLLEWHHNTTQYDRQLSFNVHPKRNNKVYIVSEKTSMILKTFNKNFGQRYILGKMLLEAQQHQDEFVVVLNYHTHLDLKMEITEKVAYSLTFYSTHKLVIDELQEDLRYSKDFIASIPCDITAKHNEIGFADAPQIFLKPNITLPNQKFHFLAYLYPVDTSLSFNIYDATYIPDRMRLYAHDPIYTSNQDFKKFDVFEGDFNVSNTCLSKFNLQIIPRSGYVSANSGYKLLVRSNLDFEIYNIPLDEGVFTAKTVKGAWDKTNSAGRDNYLHNPKFILEVGSNTLARIRIHSANPELKINAALFESPFKFDENTNWTFFQPGDKNLRLSTKMNDAVIDYSEEAWHQISDLGQLHEGTYILIPSTLEANCFSEYKVTIYLQKGTQLRVK